MMVDFIEFCKSLKCIETPEDLSKRCYDIANLLFKHYGLKCGDNYFHFAEIEFYYFRSDKFNDSWNTITYPRQDKRCGQLFYHLSGVDICFDSHYDNHFAEFGGILIRSLTSDEEGKKSVIFGPLTCKNEILNKCETMMPVICKYDEEYQCEIAATDMCGIPKEKQKGMKLCFYDKSIGIENWTRRTEVFNYKTMKIAPYCSKYKTNRFE